MKIIFFLIFILSSGPVIANPLKCVSNGNSVNITMETPHLNHAVIYRPSGETVWLQFSTEFSELGSWSITKTTKGIVYVNGIAIAQPIFNISGTYILYIANNTETEPENTFHVQCKFNIKISNV